MTIQEQQTINQEDNKAPNAARPLPFSPSPSTPVLPDESSLLSSPAPPTMTLLKAVTIASTTRNDAASTTNPTFAFQPFFPAESQENATMGLSDILAMSVDLFDEDGHPDGNEEEQGHDHHGTLFSRPRSNTAGHGRGYSLQ